MVTAVSVAPWGAALRRARPDQIHLMLREQKLANFWRPVQPASSTDAMGMVCSKIAGISFLYSIKQRAGTVGNGQLSWAQVLIS